MPALIYRTASYRPSKEFVLFRGQNVDRPLVPKIARTMAALMEEDLITSDELLAFEQERFLA